MTLSQYYASDPEASVWVAASAGTGKTKVLTDRVLRLLLSGVNPSKIICLTFTKAAASEMANRIHRELGKWVLLEDKALLDHLTTLNGRAPTVQEQKIARQLFAYVLNVPDGLKIHNVHSFCQTIIRKFPLEAGISPHFKVAETQVTDALISDVLNQMIKQKAELSEGLQTSIDRIIRHVYEGKFYTLIKEFIGKRRKLTYLMEPEGLDEAICALYQRLGVKASQTEEQEIMDSMVSVTALKQVAALMVAEGSKTDKESGEGILEWLNLSVLERVKQFESYSLLFITMEYTPRKQVATQGLQKKHPYITEILDTEQQRVIALVETIRSIRIAQLTTDLLSVGAWVIKAYHVFKMQRALLDYDDLILIALTLLRQSEVASWILYKLDGGIDHLLVDEAQDTSAEQWGIIEALSQEFFSGDTAQSHNRTLFVVGDEKQSIYSFQGADPLVFNRMQAYFEAKVTEANKLWRPIALDRSFRSTEAVLRLVDTVFASDALRRCILSQEGVVNHGVNRQGQGGHVELWPLTEPPEKDDLSDADPWPLPLSRKYVSNTKDILAQFIASKVKEWLVTPRILPSKGRPVEAGDILILVQRRDELVEAIIRHLKQQEIPVAGLDRMRLTEHIAVMDMMALGNFLLLPEDDLTLAVVLKTPLIGMDEDALFTLSHGREQGLWKTLYLRQDDLPIFKEAHTMLAALLSQVDRISPFELFASVLDAQGGRKKIISRLGVQVNDPLDEFLSLALDYEMFHIASMQGFLKSLETGQLEIKRDMDQGQNQVRVMTVHGAKGLQAPIVILPDATYLPNNPSTFLWDRELCLWSPGSHYDNQVCMALKEQHKIYEYEEYIRLLYVALTRAEDELYIGGYKQAHQPKEKTWYRLIETAMRPIAAEEEGRLWYACPQLQPVEQAQITISAEEDRADMFSLPEDDFIDRLPVADVSDVKVLTPSEEEVPVQEVGEGEKEGREKAKMRGKMIHTLLQHLPSIPRNHHASVIDYYFKTFPHGLGEDVSKNIARQVQQVLCDPQFNEVFSQNAQAEVPVVGTVGSYKISGVIDRLVVSENRLLIVDYKTGQYIPKQVTDIPLAYLKQMALYVELLERIYPDKQIECALLWISAPILQKIEISVLKNIYSALQS